MKSISSHSSHILHTSNSCADSLVLLLSPFSLHLTSLICRNLHYYANVFQRKTLFFLTNFPKSIIKDAFGYAWCPSRLQSLKLQPKIPPTIPKSEVKGKYINFPLGVGNLASFSLNHFKISFRIYRGAWKWQWDRHTLRGVLFEEFLKIPLVLFHEICHTRTHTLKDLLCL